MALTRSIAISAVRQLLLSGKPVPSRMVLLSLSVDSSLQNWRIDIGGGRCRAPSRLAPTSGLRLYSHLRLYSQTAAIRSDIYRQLGLNIDAVTLA